VDELSFRCGQMSVRREAANVLPVIVGIRDKCSVVGVCVWVLQCEETCLHALRFVAALRLSPVSLALLLPPVGCH
jgi:hypothetical protein